MSLRWIPDTCFCIIICDRPSIKGKYEKRCRIHQNSRTTLDCHNYNLLHRIKSTEIDSDKGATRQGIERIRLLKEASRR